jgi:hypothetical protein
MSQPLTLAELDLLIAHSQNNLSLNKSNLDSEELYHSLPLCITDAGSGEK